MSLSHFQICIMTFPFFFFVSKAHQIEVDHTVLNYDLTKSMSHIKAGSFYCYCDIHH